MKAGWEVKLLGEVCTLQRGFDLPKRLRTSGPFPLVTSNGPTDTHDTAKVIGPGVATGRSGTIGNVHFIEDDFWPLNTALYVKDFHGNDEKYIWYLLQAFDLSRFASGAGVPTLNRNHVHGEMISTTANLAEQKQIVAVLDVAFEGLTRAAEHAKANLQNARELFELARDTTFETIEQGWQATTIGAICDRVEYGSSQKSLKVGKTAVLRMGNIQKDELDWSDLVFTNDDAEAEKLNLRTGDVLFNRTNSAEHVGKTAIYRGEQPAIFAGYLIRLHHNAEKVHPEYLNLYLNGNAARAYGRTVMSRSVNQANINGTKLKEYPIRLPSVSDQIQIADKLLEQRKSLNAVADQYRTKLTDIADLCQSLLQKAFAGELT